MYVRIASRCMCGRHLLLYAVRNRKHRVITYVARNVVSSFGVIIVILPLDVVLLVVNYSWWNRAERSSLVDQCSQSPPKHTNLNMFCAHSSSAPHTQRLCTDRTKVSGVGLHDKYYTYNACKTIKTRGNKR